MKLTPKTPSNKWKFLLFSIILGSAISLVAGLIENPPLVGLVDATYYGYPLVWRIIILPSVQDVKLIYLVIDAAFWSFTAYLFLSIIETFPTETRYS